MKISLLRYVFELARNVAIGALLLLIALSSMSWVEYSKDSSVSWLPWFSVGVLHMVFLCCSMWLIFCGHRLFRRWWVRTVLFVALFVWGGSGYYLHPVDSDGDFAESTADRVLCAANRTVGAFLPGKGGSETLPKSASRFRYNTFHACIALYLGAWFFSIIGSGFINRLRKAWTHEKRLHVFWGSSEQGLLLAKDLVANTVWPQVEFNFPNEKSMDGSERDRLTSFVDELHGIWLFLDYENLEKSASYGVCHYFLGDDGIENIRLANRLIEISKNSKRRLERTFYIRLEHTGDEKIFFEWAKWARDQGVNPIIVREAEMIARQFAERHSPLRAKATQIDFHTGRVLRGSSSLLLGVGGVGRDILNHLLCASKFVGADGKAIVDFPITVLDANQRRWDDYVKANPEVISKDADYRIDFSCMSPNADEFEQWFRENHDKFDRIIVSMPNDETTIRVVLRLSEMFRELCIEQKEILANISDATVYGSILQRHPNVTCFGSHSEIYSMRFFRNEAVDDIAKLLHFSWSATKEEKQSMASLQNFWPVVESKWQSADYVKRQSSRASAIGEINLLYLLGFERRPHGTFAPPGSGARSYKVDSNWIAKKEISASVLETLAENEHLRWNAYHRTNGVKAWDLQTPVSIDDPTIAKKANQIDSIGRHAAIVDYDSLPTVDARIMSAAGCTAVDGKPLSAVDFEADTITLRTKEGDCRQSTTLKGYDRIFCRGIFSNALDAGLEIYKLYGKRPEDVLMESRLAANVYRKSRAILPNGFTAYDEFLHSSLIETIYKFPSGLVAFRFKRPISAPRGLNVNDRVISTSVFFYNPANGMVLPAKYQFADDVNLQGENASVVATIGLCNEQSPDFVAQILMNDERITIVFGGTVSLSDWRENLLQFRGFVPPQFKLAARLVSVVGEMSEMPIQMIGHSEGGGEVQFSYLKLFPRFGARLSGSAFNSQRLHKRIVGKADKETLRNAALHIVHYRIVNDLVSGWGRLGNDLQGLVCSLGWGDGWMPWLSFRKAHNLESISHRFTQGTKKERRAT